MSHDLKQKFLDSLLSQDQPLSSTTYEEYRTMLSTRLAAAEAKVRFAGRVTIAIWIAAAICGATALMIGRWDNAGPIPQAVQMLGFGAMVCFMVLFYYGLFRAAWYYAVERRGPQLVQQEIQSTMLQELTRKVDALASQVEKLSPRSTP
jgi:hypothetical protein